MNSFVCKFKYNDKSEQLSINIMQFLIFVVTARGLIENFIGHGTVLVDGVLILTLLYTFIKGIIVKEKFVFFYFTWLFMCFIIFLVQLLLDRTTVMGGILSFRNDVVYTFPFLFCISLIRTTDACKKIYNFMTNCGLAVCCFAIVQYFGRAFLPNKLLVVEGEGIFSFWGTDVIRVNGLVGNTIIFSNFAVIMTCYSWAHIINKEGNKKMYILFISSVIANLLTFSRASILGMVVAIIVEYFIVITDRCNRKEFIKRII